MVDLGDLRNVPVGTPVTTKGATVSHPSTVLTKPLLACDGIGTVRVASISSRGILLALVPTSKRVKAMRDCILEVQRAMLELLAVSRHPEPDRCFIRKPRIERVLHSDHRYD